MTESEQTPHNFVMMVFSSVIDDVSDNFDEYALEFEQEYSKLNNEEIRAIKSKLPKVKNKLKRICKVNLDGE